jgi:hypothetical protein
MLDLVCKSLDEAVENGFRWRSIAELQRHLVKQRLPLVELLYVRLQEHDVHRIQCVQVLLQEARGNRVIEWLLVVMAAFEDGSDDASDA